MYVVGTKSRERMQGVDDRLIAVFELALKILTHNKGHDATIPPHGGKRTAQEQNQLYLKHRSKADGINKLSYHQSGRALDVVPYINGQPTWSDKEAFYVLAAAMLQAAAQINVKLEWGGNWSIWKDLPHYQIK